MLKKVLPFSLSLAFLVFLGGCSVSESDEGAQATKREQAKSQTTSKQPVVVQPKKTFPKKAVVEPYKPEIRPYVDSKPIVSIPSEAVVTNKKENEEEDPYASIPDSDVETISSSPKISSTMGPPENRPPAKPKSSSAVRGLISQARADMLIGKHSSAESKIERGLRIEAENPQLWSLLAKAHFAQNNFSQSINMARKAIQFSRDDDVIAANWDLVKQAGENSGDAIAVKDALDYIKLNP